MGFTYRQPVLLLFVCITASLLSASFADVHRKLLVDSVMHVESSMKESPNHKSRILTVTTNDYGNYEPAPSLSKPSFKLIPN